MANKFSLKEGEIIDLNIKTATELGLSKIIGNKNLTDEIAQKLIGRFPDYQSRFIIKKDTAIPKTTDEKKNELAETLRSNFGREQLIKKAMNLGIEIPSKIETRDVINLIVEKQYGETAKVETKEDPKKHKVTA